MDKDNLDVGRIFNNLTTEALETLRSEVQQQTLSALFLTLIGLLLAVTGFVVILIKLGRLANCSVLLLAQRVGGMRRAASNSSANKASNNKLQKNCMNYYCPPQMHQLDNLQHQKANYTLRNFIERKIKTAQ